MEMLRKRGGSNVRRVLVYLAHISPAVHQCAQDQKPLFICQQLLRRCRMLVVCGNEITTAMAGEIGTAEKLKLICTTLDGLAKIKDAEQRYIN